MRVEMLRLMANPHHGTHPEGAIVDLDDAEAERRIAAGDCRPLDEPKKKRGGRAPKAPAPAQTPLPPATDPDVPVEAMTVEQLRTYAAEQAIDTGSATRKDELRALVAAEIERRRDEDEGTGD
ncbi:hypothetical protein [Streptomyces sp. NPDC006477]|uniref:hypothetical protein n=1 Tax=Streptomyces sp. NPDC006477 TaxID=3364747 RepID=UPI00368070E1